MCATDDQRGRRQGRGSSPFQEPGKIVHPGRGYSLEPERSRHQVAAARPADNRLLPRALRRAGPAAACSRRSWVFRPVMIPLGLVFGAMTGCYLGAVKTTTAANAIYLQYTATFWVVPLGMLFLGERPDRRALVGIGLAMLGIAVIVGWGYDGRPDEWRGVALGLASGLGFAAVATGMRGLARPRPDLAQFRLSTCSGPWRWALDRRQRRRDRSADAPQVFDAARLWRRPDGLPYVLFARGLREIGTAEAGLIALIEPILNPIWVVLAVGERPAVPTLVGGSFLLGWRRLPLLAARDHGAASRQQPAESDLNGGAASLDRTDRRGLLGMRPMEWPRSLVTGTASQGRTQMKAAASTDRLWPAVDRLMAPAHGHGGLPRTGSRRRRTAGTQAKGKKVDPGDQRTSSRRPTSRTSIKRFETDDREVFVSRHEIIKALGLKPGMAVADIGAGTGLFTRLFAERGGAGRESLRGRHLAGIPRTHRRPGEDEGPGPGRHGPRHAGLHQLAARLGRPGVSLRRLPPPRGPREVLASIHQALRPAVSWCWWNSTGWRARAAISCSSTFAPARRNFGARSNPPGFEPVAAAFTAPTLKENFFARFRKRKGRRTAVNGKAGAQEVGAEDDRGGEPSNRIEQAGDQSPACGKPSGPRRQESRSSRSRPTAASGSWLRRS